MHRLHKIDSAINRLYIISEKQKDILEIRSLQRRIDREIEGSITRSKVLY